MCIAIWTLAHPDYALILGSNRDEFLDRPTQNAHFHSFGMQSDGDIEPNQILSGRDLVAGGSWFGISRSGRIAILTNITEPVTSYKSSRGSLVSSFLLSKSSHPLEDEIGHIVPEDANYAGFNLLLLSPTLNPSSDGGTAVTYESLFVTNHGGGGTLTSRPLRPDEQVCGGISNGVDGAGAERWLKLQHATKEFDAAFVQSSHSPSERITESNLTEQLFNILSWHPESLVNERKELRNTVQVLPVPIHLDGPAGNPKPEYYATRLSTVLLVSKKGEVVFIERDIWELDPNIKEPHKSIPPTERRFDFTFT